MLATATSLSRVVSLKTTYRLSNNSKSGWVKLENEFVARTVAAFVSSETATQ